MGRVFQRTVERHPERTAVVDQDEGIRYTYDEWNNHVERVAAGLRNRGVGAGDRVGVIMQPRVQAGTVYWAAQRLGAVFTPYNIRAAADEVEFLVNNTDPDVLLFSQVSREAVVDSHEAFENVEDMFYIDDDTPSFAEEYDNLLADIGSSIPEPSDDSDSTSVILHTSGTTGRPKGVPRTHRNTYSAAVAHAIQSEWNDSEITLGLMPIYHTMGLRALATSTLLSGTWVAQRSFSPDQTAALIESESITSLYLVPTVFHDLVRSGALDGVDVSSVKRLGYAGTPMTAAVQQDVRDAFEPETFVNHYGSTEVYTYSVCSWIDEKPTCAGRAGINTRVRVVQPESGDTVPPTNTVSRGDLGEIIVDASSPEAFNGYLNRPEADEKSFENGWYFTGDLGYRDEDGDLFVVGRVDDMINSGGENIYPVEVENALDGHEDVGEVAVVGLSDERWNQVVTAFVRLDKDSENADFNAIASRLDEYCREGDDLANFKRPRKYVFVDEIVKSNVGKVLRRELTLDDIDVDIHAEINV